MNRTGTQSASLLHRVETRLALFGLAGVLAVWLGFPGLSVPTAQTVLKHGGYHIMLLSCGLFLHALWRIRGGWAGAVEPLTRRQRWLVAAVIGLFSLLAIAAEPFRSKILNDEFVLQSTAYNLHYFREMATMVRGYEVQGVFLSLDNYLDKRPFLYPFLVSVLHDLTGYRVLNAYLVNALLMPVTLTLAFVFGRQLSHWRGGLLAVLLLGSLPLLGQNATGSGMELLNVAMILVNLILATEFLRVPEENRLAAFLLGIVLLAQARYESALYAASAALVVAAGCWRARRLILPWPAVAAPLLLLPVALQNKVIAHSPLLWELTDQASSRFSLDYFPRNLRGAGDFLFNTNPRLANSLLLTVLGLAAVAWVVWRLGRVRPRPVSAEPARLAFFCFSLAILANTLLIFCYYWSSFDDAMAARFSLPLHLLFAFCAVLMAEGLDRRWPATPWLLLLTAVFACGFSTTRYASHLYSHLGIDEIEWTLRYVNARPPAPRLVLTNRTSLPWLLQKTPAILLDRSRLVAGRLQEQLREHTFAEILVLQSLRPTSSEGWHELVMDDRLPPGFHLEQLAEKRFGTKLARISRLVAIDDSAVVPEPKLSR